MPSNSVSYGWIMTGIVCAVGDRNGVGAYLAQGSGKASGPGDTEMRDAQEWPGEVGQEKEREGDPRRCFVFGI